MSTSNISTKDTAWTDWEWNEDKKKWGRWRMRKGKYEIDWRKPDSATQSTSKGNESGEGVETRPQSSLNSLPKDGRIVTHIRVVAHLSQDIGGMSENHWSIYLLLEGDASVRLNMTAEYGNTTGTLVVNEFSYQLTSSALRHWDYNVVPGVTVQMVRDVVRFQGRDRYQFSGGGSGCRYWW